MFSNLKSSLNMEIFLMISCKAKYVDWSSPSCLNDKNYMNLREHITYNTMIFLGVRISTYVL